MLQELLTCNFPQSIVTKALQPNITIRAHIMAPPERRQKVLEEITRPVFTYRRRGHHLIRALSAPRQRWQAKYDYARYVLLFMATRLACWVLTLAL